MWQELVDDWNAAKRGEVRIARSGRGRVYARYGEGPMDVKIGGLARLSLEIKVLRANGTVEKYRVGRDGQLIPIKDGAWRTFTQRLVKGLLQMSSMARSLLRRITT